MRRELPFGAARDTFAAMPARAKDDIPPRNSRRCIVASLESTTLWDMLSTLLFGLLTHGVGQIVPIDLHEVAARALPIHDTESIEDRSGLPVIWGEIQCD